MFLGVRLCKCALLSAFLGLFLCQGVYGKASQKTFDKPLVVASIRPLALLVNDIAGDLVHTDVLINNASSPHDFSLTIAQAVALSEADLLVWIGPEFESFLSKRFDADNSLSMIGEENAGTDNSRDNLDDGFQHASEQKHHHKGHAGHNHSDPHLWLSHGHLVVFARQIADKLIALLPHQKAVLEKRLAHVLVALEIRRGVIKDTLAQYDNLPFAVHHDAYHEFIKEYGLNQVVAVTSVPHERISAKRLGEIGRQITAAKCILAEKAEWRQAKRYADLFEKPLIEVDLLAVNTETQSFDGYLQALAGSFTGCFSF